MAKKKKVEFCTSPDRHVPKIKCGYPLPCPYHTVVAEVIPDSYWDDIAQQSHDSQFETED